MRISTSKSEAMVLSQKKVQSLFWVGEEILPQVEEIEYLRVLCTSKAKMEQEIDRRFGVASAVMRTLCQSAMVKIYWSIFYSYSHLWSRALQLQATEMSFLRRVAGPSLRDRVRSSAIQSGAAAPPH